ncbi:helix-turn-helix domain-containing protein [Xanthobacter variabilis]
MSPAQGQREIARRLRVSPQTVNTWRKRLRDESNKAMAVR